MASSSSHPRRRPASPSIDDLADSLKNISIRKGTTFHPSYRNNESTIFDQFKDLKIPSLPSRSTTCPNALEDLLIGAGERRAFDLISRVDDAIAQRTQLSSVFNEPEVLPVPRFMVEHAGSAQDKPVVKQEFPADDEAHRHRADSGIGSSIAESAYEKLQGLRTADNRPATSGTSAVTQSFSSNAQGDTVGLSDFAQKQIHKFIVTPILRETSLKEFHPLVRDVPSRIDTKEIKTLRDLEKTLIFLAPDFSRSPAAYRSFCEASIRCLHLTVDTVHESDQCLPSDRPYNTGYFIDLVEQIRRYATILAATREKQARGEELDEMDATPEDRIELQGGVSHNGKAAFLTVTKDGKNFTNLADNQPVPAQEAATMSAKRPMEASIDDDGARRSMARRKKGAPILTYHCQHQGCGKTFKRPCDLTKHDKTHDRPFKCPETDCKYNTLGWPTEKECDRHYNDKHSDAPKLYSCEFADCPYTSKRESNCKQHMEKSHGWEYTRSKANGRSKGKGKAVAKASSSLAVQSTTPSNFGSDMSTPLTSVEPSPLTTASNDMAQPEMKLLPKEQCFDANGEILFDFGVDFAGHFNTDMFSGAIPTLTPAWTEDQVMSGNSSTHQSPFDNQFETNFNMGTDFQQLTPSSSNHDFKEYTHAHPDSARASSTNPPLNTFSPRISPNAGDLMFTNNHFDDNMQVDEGLGDGTFGTFAPTGDFALYEGTNYNATPLFPEEQNGLGNMGSQFGTQYGPGDFDVKSLFPGLQLD
ncbi:hypothetical protein MBLNU457_g0692t1 [Dothideomycetes sp. NU457]